MPEDRPHYGEAPYQHTKHFLEALVALANKEAICSTVSAKLVRNDELFDLVLNAKNQKSLLEFVRNYYNNSVKFDRNPEFLSANRCLMEKNFLGIWQEISGKGKYKELREKDSKIFFYIERLPSDEKDIILKWLFEEWNRKRELKGLKPLDLTKLPFGFQSLGSLQSFCTSFSPHNSDDYAPDFRDPTIRFPEGSLPPDSPFYIERPPTEENCYQAIRQPSSLIRIRAPKLMGKTSLMNRILDRAAKQGARTVQIDFNSADSTTLADKGKLLRWFWRSITRELKLQKQVVDGNDKSISNFMCTIYFEDYLLPEIDTALILGLDQVDRLFPYESTAQDFFALIRSWHGKNSDNLWRRLRLIITYATDVYIPLNNNQSPFNVGVPIELPDFSEKQILELAKRYNLNWNEEQASKLYGMVGGHPHLIRIAIYNSSQKSFSLNEILQSAPTQESIYTEHLNDCLRTLKKDRTLCDAFRNVVTSLEPIKLNPEETRILERIGLVKKKGDMVSPRYKLHREFFQKFL
ncbi:MAG: hypothetical protein F6J86_06645 [Symploca sp. SIO1B1]|nr:hypothetical protein [Symploca sp. SIO1B1]